MEIASLVLLLVAVATCAMLVEKPMLGSGSIPNKLSTAAVVGIIGAWVGHSLVGPAAPDKEALYELSRHKKELEAMVEEK